MIFQLFEAIADRVRDQAADYASAQARIGARSVIDALDPFGMGAAVAGMPFSPAPAARSSGRRARRGPELKASRTPRQSRRSAASAA